MTIRLIYILIMLLSFYQVQAQEQIKFHHFTTYDGLSSNSIRCLYQDRKGFIWIGTDGGGLNRYDGNHFTVFSYRKENPHSISNNQIFAITEDHLGYIWIGTSNGLNRYDPNTGWFKRFYNDPNNPKSLKHSKVTALFEDSENTLWVGTLLGLHEYVPATESFVNYIEGMTSRDPRPDREINSILDDTQGNLWIGTWWGGLKKFNKSTAKFTDFFSDSANPYGIRNNNVMSLYLDKEQILWIGNYMGGIRKLNVMTGKYLPINDPEKDANIMGMCIDQAGKLWYSRTGAGIIDPVSQTFQLLDFEKTTSTGINQGAHFRIMCDKTGIIWIGSEFGLSLYDANREKFTSYYRPVNTDHARIEKFYLDHERDMLWIGTLKNGLFKYNEKNREVTHFPTNKSLDNRFFEIQTLYGNGKEQLWIGTNNGLGILDMKTGKIIHTRYNNPIRPTLVNRVYGNDEFMWLINDNVKIFDILRKKEYDFSTQETLALPCQQITSVLDDTESNLWIGTFEGLAKYNCITHEIENYYNKLDDSTSISNKYILSVFQDSRKNIWVGTQNGLNRYNARTRSFDRYTPTSFASYYILNIKEDQHQNLWLFTDKGITKFNPDNGLIRNYDKNDGLDFGGQVLSGKNGWFYCTHRTEDYYVFHPDSIKDNQVIPPVYITRFLLFNKEVAVTTKTHKTPLHANISETKEIILAHDQTNMSFEFVALNYTLPEKNQYAYQMEGFDNDWYYTDASHRSATYTNLNPGTYTFRVKASNNDGVWNHRGTEIKIVILPPFWKTPLAYFIYFILIVGLIYVLRYYLLFQHHLKTKIEIERIKAEKTHEIDQLKLDFFGNISHEFRTPLTLLSGPLDYFIELQPECNGENERRYFNIMKRNVDHLLHLIDKVLDIRKLDAGYLNVSLKKDDIIQFVKSLTESFTFKAQQKNIRFNIIFHYNCYKTWFDPDLINKIVYNLLSNAFKFTPDQGEITIETIILKDGTEDLKSDKECYDIKSSSDLVKFIVTDNGIGIPSEQKEKVFGRFYQANNQANRSGGSGIGLALVKELVELVEGKIYLESEVKRGSCFTIWIPIGMGICEPLEDYHPVFETDSNASGEACQPSAFRQSTALHIYQTDESSEKAMILVVEDNQDMQSFIYNILQNDYEVLLANNGKSGLELAMEFIPDLIVSDIMMPDMDGLQMCQYIKNNERTNHIPLVLLTARSTEEYQIEGLFAGADDYIMKPFNTTNLLLRIGNIIKARQLLREKFSLSEMGIHGEQPAPLNDTFINKMKSIVENHLDNPDFDPQLFANEIGMSRAQLYRKIKAITNHSVNDFIFSVRINKAALIMRTEDLSVSETAYAVGFKTPAHFSKMFSTHMGMSPSKYIEHHKKSLA